MTFFLQQLDLHELVAEKASPEQLAALASLIKGFSVTIVRTFPLEKSFVTGGGVHLKEINQKPWRARKSTACILLVNYWISMGIQVVSTLQQRFVLDMFQEKRSRNN